MRGDVAGVRRDDALMGAQDRGDHGAVDLRAADEELHLALRQSAALAQQGAGSFAVGILSVAGVCSPFVSIRARSTSGCAPSR